MNKKFVLSSRIITSIVQCGFIVFTQLLAAQAPSIEWIKGYGNPYGSHVHQGIQTNDGGYIGVGTSSITDMEQPVGLVIKIDSSGNKEWSTVLGTGSNSESGSVNHIVEKSDGSFVVAGASVDKGEQERALFFLDASGNVTGKRTYPHKGYDAIEGIDITSDGGIIATGYLNGDQPEGFIIYDGQCFIMKTDANGILEWDKTLDIVFHGMKVLQTPDGGYAVCSNIFDPETQILDFCLVKTNNNGQMIWNKSYGGQGMENCFDFDLAKDGGFVLGGHTRSFAKHPEGWDVWLVKTDRNGNMEWNKNFGEPQGGDPLWIYDECYGIKTTLDGGYIMAAGSGIEPENVKGENPNNFWSSYVIRTDSSGNLLWEHIYKLEDDHNAAEYINICKDGGYIVFLDADGLLPGGTNAFGFMKLAPDIVK